MLTPSTRLRDFPSLHGMTYLNTAAESIPPRCVGEAIQEYWQHKQLGMKGRVAHFARVEACREISARMLGREPGEVSFCSCSSEAYNLLAGSLNLQAQDEVVISDLDFPAGATPWLSLTPAPKVHLWKAREGALEVDDLKSLLNPGTRLVQVSLVSFYNGHRINWKSVHDAVRRLAPQAVLSVDVTQALGRVVLDCQDADIVISSTHKWTLGIHGGCIIGIPQSQAGRLTTRAGGWFHLRNAFEADRFQQALPKPGAASFSVGMPNFVALYALNASLRYLEQVGIAEIEAHANPLMARLHAGLAELGVKPMSPAQPQNPAGILAFQHPQTAELHTALEKENVHVMHHAGRIRVAVHGYNTEEDIGNLLRVLGAKLKVTP